MRIAKTIISLLLLTTLSACATPVTEQSIQNIKNKDVIVATFSPATLEAMTGGQAALLGPLGAPFTARMKGHSIVQKQGIPDPAVGMIEGLSKELAAKYNLNIVSSETIENIPVPKIKDIGEEMGAELILVGNTINFSSIYFLTDPNNYKTRIMMTAQFQDIKTGKKVLSTVCSYSPKYEQTNDAPSWEYLYEDGAIGMKEIIKDAQSYCIKKLMEEEFIF